MNRRFRLITAAAFAVLFFLIPSPDTTSGRAYLGTLKVREWLLDSEGPLNAYVQDGTIPPLAVQYIVSPMTSTARPGTIHFRTWSFLQSGCRPKDRVGLGMALL